MPRREAIINNMRWVQAADVYAYGVLLWELWCARHAWEGFTYVQVINAVAIQGQRLEFPEAARPPPSYANLAYRCMAASSNDRPRHDAVQMDVWK